MLKAVKWAGKAIGAGAIAILVLSAFCLLYSYSDAHVENASGATDYKWQSNGIRTTMREGFSWLRMDADGFNNQWNPRGASVSVLLMGSSHEEAFSIHAAQSTAYILNSLLQASGSYCYSIAMSGHTICHNIKNLSAAVNEYKPTDCVVIETYTVHPSENEMASVIDNTFAKIPSYDKGALLYLQKIPALKAIYKNAESLLFSVPEAAESVSREAESPAYESVLKAFLEKAKADAGDVGLMIIYHPSMLINADGTVNAAESADYAARFSRLCSESGIGFIDMTEPFISHYNETCELPHGFSNTQVGAGHLNSAGHKLMAEAIYEILAAQEASE